MGFFFSVTCCQDRLFFILWRAGRFTFKVQKVSEYISKCNRSMLTLYSNFSGVWNYVWFAKAIMKKTSNEWAKAHSNEAFLICWLVLVEQKSFSRSSYLCTCRLNFSLWTKQQLQQESSSSLLIISLFDWTHFLLHHWKVRWKPLQKQMFWLDKQAQ